MMVMVDMEEWGRWTWWHGDDGHGVVEEMDVVASG